MPYTNMREGDRLHLDGPKFISRDNGVEDEYSFEAIVQVDSTGLFSLVARIKRNGRHYLQESVPVRFRTDHGVIQINPYASGGMATSYNWGSYTTGCHTSTGGGQ